MESAMAFTDPLNITVAGTALVLPRTGVGASSSSYNDPAKTLSVNIAHTYGSKRIRRQWRHDFNKIAADPLTSANTRYTGSAYVVIDHPPVGFSVDELVNQLVALADALKAGTSNAQAKKFIGGES